MKCHNCKQKIKETICWIDTKPYCQFCGRRKKTQRKLKLNPISYWEKYIKMSKKS